MTVISSFERQVFGLLLAKEVVGLFVGFSMKGLVNGDDWELRSEGIEDGIPALGRMDGDSGTLDGIMDGLSLFTVGVVLGRMDGDPETRDGIMDGLSLFMVGMSPSGTSDSVHPGDKSAWLKHSQTGDRMPPTILEKLQTPRPAQLNGQKSSGHACVKRGQVSIVCIRP